MPKKSFSFFSMLLDVFELFLISIIVFIVVYFFVGQLLEIDGESMVPTIQNGEEMIAEKISIKFRELERGDVVIFVNPLYPSKSTNRLIVKRIVGMPGELVVVSDGNVYINNTKLQEDYLNEQQSTYSPCQNGHLNGNEEQQALLCNIEEDEPYKVPQDAYVVLGDNRAHSRDSREWGGIPKESIIGRALLVYKPLNNIRFIK